MRRWSTLVTASLILAMGAPVMAQSEAARAAAGDEPVVGVPQAEGSVVVTPADVSTGPPPVQGTPVRYDEYYVVNPGVKVSYIPGFIPKVTSYFLNPRTPVAKRGRVETISGDRALIGTPGWHLGNPKGYTSGTPKDSPALDYHTGKAGVTKILQFGYPQGQRVIEPVYVPTTARAERGGFFISAGTVTRLDVQQGSPYDSGNSTLEK